ncbi:MAG: sulfur carrier protein ThiS [Pseudonocardiaceae bacterium]|nr:sulfur carrier protein ThiS [Pseudonocardiaceae bacterium]
MKAEVNGEPTELAERSTVADVLRGIGKARKGVAVAMNGQLVRRSDWEETVVPEGARIEVLTAVQGG